jgi:hypothetical protein
VAHIFEQLVATELNLAMGTDASCIQDTVNAAQAWMTAHPVGSGVAANSPAWQQEGSALHGTLDAYNNGLMCAPSGG